MGVRFKANQGRRSVRSARKRNDRWIHGARMIEFSSGRAAERAAKEDIAIMDACGTPGNWLLFHNDLVLVKSKTPLLLPSGEEIAPFADALLRFGTLSPARGGFSWGECPPDGELPPGLEPVGLRELWALGGEAVFHAAGTAFQMMDWRRNSRYCPRCATLMEAAEEGRAYACPQCEYVSYPILSPAIIVAVVRDGKLLLAHGTRFPSGRYSVLAGFVEPGESLEEAVSREIYEESGVCVKNIRYFGSQPWPFPNSLMLGFRAEWESGEIVPETSEVSDVRWFAPAEIKNYYRGVSISAKLIEDFIRRHS